MTAQAGDITLYVDDPAGPRLAGSILPFHTQPSADKTDGDLCGVKVRYGRGRYGSVSAVYVRDWTDADILFKALSRR